jgi:hypothetical protein
VNAKIEPVKGAGAQHQAFLSDLATLRSRARQQSMSGAATPGFPQADRLAIVDREDVPQE